MAKKFKVNRQMMSTYLYNGKDIILIEEGYNLRGERKIKNTVIICDGHSMRIAETNVDEDIMRTVVETDKLMFNEEYEKYFDLRNTRVIKMYIQKKSISLENGADELANFIKNNVQGNILLIGRGKGGLVMHQAAGTVSKNVPKSKVAIITVDVPFLGTPLATKRSFYNSFYHCPKYIDKIFDQICDDNPTDKELEVGSSFLSKLTALPRDVRYINITGSIYNFHFERSDKYDKLFEEIDGWCELDGDGFSSFNSQIACSIPTPNEGFRTPDVLVTVGSTYHSSLKKVIENYAGRIDEIFDDFKSFKKKEDLRDF